MSTASFPRKSLRQKNNVSDLEKLKELLLSDELERLKELEERLREISVECRDPEALREKISPLFDEILSRHLRSKDRKTIEILARHLAEILRESSEIDLPSLTHALQKVLSPAIADEISANKERMIDALYPIMGGMISKYVTNAIRELVASINAKIDEGFSLRSLKRKIKAKVTGVSESELLLEEAAEPTLESIFVIQKETGLLVAEAHLPQSGIDDPTMVASMASAIKDFINDWISSQSLSSIQEVQLLSYGDATLYIEEAGSVYLIAFLDAEPGYDLRKRINRFFSSLLEEYSDFFQHFDGDDSRPEISEIHEKILDFLQSECDEENLPQSERNDKTSFAKILFGLLAAALLGVLLYRGGLSLLRDYRFGQIEKKIAQQTGEHVRLSLGEDGKVLVSGTLKHLKDAPKILAILHRNKISSLRMAFALPVPELLERLDESRTLRDELNTSLEKLQDDLASQSRRYASLLEELNTTRAQLLHLRRQLRDLNASLSQQARRRERIVRQLHFLQGIDEELRRHLRNAFRGTSLLRADGKTLDFRSEHLFHPGSSNPDPKSLRKLTQAYIRYISALFSDARVRPYLHAILVEGHTDSSGNARTNLRLSKERAQKIMRYFRSLDVTRKYRAASLLQAQGVGSSDPVIVGGREDHNASRRISIRYEIDRDKVQEAIQRIVK